MNQRTVWLAGLGVAVGAATLTAHGVFEVAAAARVPRGVAWLYPLITDGLALVAYASTTRLGGPARRYAWSIVILAAGLSGLAQAAYLASDAALDPTRSLPVAAALRFGVGAWPAIAAAIAAHLVYLLAGSPPAVALTPVPVPDAHRASVRTEDGTEGPGTAGLTPRPDPGPQVPAAPVPDAGKTLSSPPGLRSQLARDEQRALATGAAALWGLAELRAGRTAGKRRIGAQFPQLTESFCDVAAKEARRLAAGPAVRPVVNQ